MKLIKGIFRLCKVLLKCNQSVLSEKECLKSVDNDNEEVGGKQERERKSQIKREQTLNIAESSKF